MMRWAWMLVLLVACTETEPATQIVVSVATDYDVPEDLRNVRFEVQTVPDGRVRLNHQVLLRGKDERDFPLTLALTSINKGKPVVHVIITGQLADASIVRREAIVSFRAGQILSLPMNLLSVCRDQLCEAGETTCVESGRCEPVARDDLEQWPGEDGLPGVGTPGADGSTNAPRADGSIRSDGSVASDGGIASEGGVEMDGSAGSDAGMTAESNILSLSVGSHHSCAVMRNGRVYCWGGNARNALGSTTSEIECPGQVCPAPRQVPNVQGAIQVVSGERFSCALTGPGEVWCWGGNSDGQIGAATNEDSAPPTRVRFRETPEGTTPFLTGIDALAAGRGFVCARVAATKALACWGGGSNAYRQVPVDGPGTNVATPTTIIGDVEGFSLGHFHGCFISAVGGLACWGSNSDAQLGLAPAATFEYRLTPYTVYSSGVTAVAGGEAHTCAIVAGDVRCFGIASAGQLGFGPVPTLPMCTYGFCTPDLGPAEPPSTSPPVALALGDRLSCARYQDGRVACWGSNELSGTGQPTPGSQLTPAFVPQLVGARIVAAGYNHVCAATADEIVCWGSNAEGQLGPNATAGTSSAQLNQVPIATGP